MLLEPQHRKHPVLTLVMCQAAGDVGKDFFFFPPNYFFLISPPKHPGGRDGAGKGGCLL